MENFTGNQNKKCETSSVRACLLAGHPEQSRRDPVGRSP